jgi:putative spermidine/putrescine transport system ATP-binding protein
VDSDQAPAPGKALTLRAVTKSYSGTAAVTDVNLEVAAGEFMTFLGPSGSGKTTTLNMIAGFTHPSSGQILLGDADISRVPSHRRGIGMVFQHYALFPHMTVRQNVEYPLKQRKVPRHERADRVRDALRLVELDGFADRRPAQLSGGQQQRVALARALVFRPPLLLMDEPLGALDKRLREVLQLEIKRIHQELGITFVYVTHDQDEALLLSDRIAVFQDGAIQQVGTAEGLYERPRTRFVAEFVGDSNTFAGVLDPRGRVLTLEDGRQLHAPDCSGIGAETTATVVLRPERARLRSPGGPRENGENALPGRVASLHYLGSACKIEVDTSGAHRVVVREAANARSDVRLGDRVEVYWHTDDTTLIVDDPAAGLVP